MVGIGIFKIDLERKEIYSTKLTNIDMIKEVSEDRERIKWLVQETLEKAKATNYIRVGPSRLQDLITRIQFNIDTPDYVQKEEDL